MTPERWQQVKDIFDRAVERAPASRIAFIRECCGSDDELRKEVESLLASDTETGSLLDGPAVALRMAVDPPTQDGTRIGPYEILRELGKGGMGSVYLARRTDGVYPNLVALKVLRSGYASPDLLHRFDQECRILASLNHPNIARFFDGGKTAEGLPYYVMEFIEGQPIDRHCDQQRLDLKSRLALFQQVCDAVNCAHRSGIVHRDLKPSNILVTPEGVVKLLDFGIAKLLQPDPGGATIWLTDSGLRPMTPEYASPEQIQEEELTRATDVYSLGVVLYEMLTGRRPYRLRSRVFHEILRVVCEEQPTLPSLAAALSPDFPGTTPTTDSDTLARLRQTTPGDLRKQLSGDLDSIVMKALRKEPWQRYASAAQFGEDVRRHLEGSPVEARSGRLYKLRKQLNRQRGWLAAAVFLSASFASGGIHVAWPALWVGAAVCSAFGIWHASADREFGRKVAASSLWPVLIGLLAVPAVILAMDSDILRGALEGVLSAMADISGGRMFSPSYADVFGYTRLWWLSTYNWDGLWSIALGVLCVRWIVRERWGGSLVLHASSRRSRTFGIFAVALFICCLSNLVIPVPSSIAGGGTLQTGPHPWTVNAFGIGVEVLPWALLYALSGRLEFRQSGIVTASGFYRWPNIESYVRSKDSLDGRAVLTLKVRGRHPLLPTPKIKVPQPKRHEVETVMARFLSEWPVGTEK